jgi:hypothetical protein
MHPWQPKRLLWLLALCSLMPTLGLGLLAPLARPSAQTSAPDPRFGLVEAFWDSSAAVEAGAGWERILFQWSQLQPNGPDDWNTLHVPDEWLQWAQAQGREVVGLLKNTPHWATDADPPMEASPPRGLDLPIDDPNNTWATFVRRAVTFFGARGVHRWIIWNEPDIQPGVYGQEWAGTVDEYYRLLKVAYLVIREVDPGARVHLAGITFWHDKDWLRRFLSVATADPEGPPQGYFFDVVSLHIYFQTDSVDYIVNETRQALAAYGLDKPIWINETNASPDSDPEWPIQRPRWRVDLTEQASFVLQSFALGLASGAERIAVYRLIDAGLPPGGEPFGLLRPDHSRRPAYTAYQLVTQHYAGARAGTISRQPTVAHVTLDRGERTTRVFWARTQADVTLTVPAFASQALLVDQTGNVQPLDGSSGVYTLTLPGARCADEVLGCIIGGPTYLLIEEAPPGDPGSPVSNTATPTAEAQSDLPTPTAVTATVTATITPTTLPVSVTMTPLPSATPPPSPTALPSATPTPSPLPPTRTRAPTATVAPATSTPTPLPSATWTITFDPTAGITSPVPASATPAPPDPTERSALLNAGGIQALILGALLFIAGLLILALRKILNG